MNKEQMVELIRDLAVELASFERSDGYGDSGVVEALKRSKQVCAENGIFLDIDYALLEV